MPYENFKHILTYLGRTIIWQNFRTLEKKMHYENFRPILTYSGRAIIWQNFQNTMLHENLKTDLNILRQGNDLAKFP